MVAFSLGADMFDEDNTSDTKAAEGSVVDRILSAFVDKVEAEPGMAEVGGRLRRVLFELREDSEVDLRAAIFGGDAA